MSARTSKRYPVEWEWAAPGQMMSDRIVVTFALPLFGVLAASGPFPLQQAYVLNAFRQAGVPMQRIRPSLDWLVQHVGPHALASKNLYTDGAEVLWEFARQADEDDPDAAFARGLIVPRSGQYVFKEIVEHYLRQISFSEDNYANLIRLPQYQHANVVLDPRRGFGQPVFGNSGVRVVDAIGPLRAGESFDAVAEDYGVSVSELRDALDLSA